MNTWEFDTTVGAGSEVVTVVYEYEQDLDDTFKSLFGKFGSRGVIASGC